MAAPKNDAERARIYNAAIKLFCREGYERTTYRAIAETCETTRSAVQYYYPQKDQFVAQFFNAHLECIYNRVQEKIGTHSDVLETFCMMGLLHFDFLLNDRSVRPFISDVIANRALTASMVISERDWAEQHMPKSKLSVSNADALTVALGGAYELIYQAYLSKSEITPLYVEEAAILPFALGRGYTRKHVKEILKKCSDLL
ncbi:MAG: TetR/AcrR family transcriptional regulator [Eggerthellaceae bacterium]